MQHKSIAILCAALMAVGCMSSSCSGITAHSEDTDSYISSGITDALSTVYDVIDDYYKTMDNSIRTVMLSELALLQSMYNRWVLGIPSAASGSGTGAISGVYYDADGYLRAACLSYTSDSITYTADGTGSISVIAKSNLYVQLFSELVRLNYLSGVPRQFTITTDGFGRVSGDASYYSNAVAVDCYFTRDSSRIPTVTLDNTYVREDSSTVYYLSHPSYLLYTPLDSYVAFDLSSDDPSAPLTVLYNNLTQKYGDETVNKYWVTPVLSPPDDNTDPQSGSLSFSWPEGWITGGNTLDAAEPIDIGVDVDGAFDAFDDIGFDDYASSDSFLSVSGFFWALFSKIVSVLDFWPFIFICLTLLLLSWFLGR